MRKIALSVLIASLVQAAGAQAQTSAGPLVGRWNFDNPRWEGFVVRSKTLAMGGGECGHLPYRALERVADTFYVEASHPEGRCVPAGQRGIFLQLTLTAPDGMHFRSCSSREELEKLKTAPDRAQCSSFYGHRVPAKGL